MEGRPGMARKIYKSQNLNRKFSHAARVISKKISGIDGVIGILAIGGLTRGHSDSFSDLDLIVYAESDKAPAIRRYISIGFLSYKGIGFDILVESYSKAMRSRVPSNYWNQIQRWTLDESKIMYDTGGRIARMLKEKVIFPESERRKMMRGYHHETDEILNYIFPAWELRGYTYHLAGLLRRAIEYIVLWIYAKNGKFQPYLNKWLFYHLEKGNVGEAKYFADIKRAYMESISNMEQARRMQKRLLKLCDKIGMKIEPVDMNKIFDSMKDNWDKASKKTKEYLSF